MQQVRTLTVGAMVAVLLQFPAAVLGTEYKVDHAHTTVAFGVRHLFTTVNGIFRTFEGKMWFDPQRPEETKVEGSIEAASIDTNIEKRDNHLRSEDFFHVDKYPKITFASTQVTDVDESKKGGKLHGNLTLHGVTKPIVLDVVFLGQGKDPWGNTRAGFHAETTINRKDFGLTWNETLETGAVLVGEEVRITIDAEGVPVGPTDK